MLSILCIFTIALSAAFYDVSTGKIPNVICVYGVISGVAYALLDTVYTVADCLTGIAIPVLILFLVYRLRIIGAGDVKLYSAIGAYMGKNIIIIIGLSFLMAAMVGMFRIIARIVNYLCCVRIGTDRRKVPMVFKTSTICFSIPIAVSVVMFFVQEVLLGKI